MQGGLDLLKHDCHDMGCCLGKGQCQRCDRDEACFDESTRLTVGVLSYGFFHHPAYKQEIQRALASDMPQASHERHSDGDDVYRLAYYGENLHR
jgi:hypothetical protein